ncbi:MAG: hypothetical protein ACP5CD_04240 [Thermovirgaceae bacterium]
MFRKVLFPVVLAHKMEEYLPWKKCAGIWQTKVLLRSRPTPLWITRLRGS